jgi:peptidoglycan/LPS O-acetylase OafA/YrhL
MTFDPPTWTLAIEVQFYLALPLLGLLASRAASRARSPLTVPLATIAAGLVWNGAVYRAGLPLPFGKVLPAALPYFGAGMLAAVLAETRQPSPRASRALFAGGVAAVLADVAIHWGPIGSGPLLFVSETLHDLLAALGFAAIVAAAAAFGHRALQWRPLVALGTISYGVYLWNVPLLLALRAGGALPLQPLLALPLVLAAAMAVAALSWLYVERPALAWAHRRPHSA